MIRCRKCDHSNPEDHRFCGMCGATLESAHPLQIDDEDPLELEAPVYEFEERSRTSQVGRRDRQREQVRDTSSIQSNGRKRTPPAGVETFPREIVEPTVESEYGAINRNQSTTGIGGPSFLGLNYDAASNPGFVYDKPRNDGFVYDTDGPAPEYLLEEIPRGVSWRAWALFLLLIVGGGLGYIQWRASHHQGPDLASILARNGPTVDPSGPVMPDKSAKPADKTNTASNNSSDGANANAKENSQAPEDKNASGSIDGNADEDSPAIYAGGSSAKSDASSPANNKAAKNNTSEPADNTNYPGDTSNTKSAAADRDEDTKSAKPESDGPVSKATKPRKAEVADEEPAQPKTLGDKDPLIIQASKYIQGRGVRKSCATGVNLLRQAVSEGNPAASVKLGALYWSGTCVTQSKVTAYQWFSRAHSLEPKNRWVERSRNSLWASMSPEEQRRSSY